MDSDNPDTELGPILTAMVLQEFQIISTVAQDAFIEFDVGEVAAGEIIWDQAPGLFRFQISLTSLGVLGRHCLEAARDFSAENYALSQAKQKNPPRRAKTRALIGLGVPLP